MASYARDIYFGVRVEDRATRPLRRIARDFAMLGKAGLQQRTAAAQQAAGAERAARARVKDVQLTLQRTQAEQAYIRQQLASRGITEEMSAAIAQSNAQMRLRTTTVQRLIIAEQRLAAEESILADRFVATSAAHSTAIRNMNEADDAVRRFPADRLQGIANYTRHAGAVLTTFGAITTASLALAGKAAADFSTQVTVAATQSTVAGRNSVAQVQRNAQYLQSAITKMLSQGQVIATPQDQTSATYKIFSGTTLPGNQAQQLREGIGLLKEFNSVTTANAGLVNLDEVVQAGLTILNRFRVPLKELPKDLNTMQAAVRFGNLNLSQFIGAMNQAAPAAQGAGYSFTQMSAAIAFLSRQFPSLRIGVTGYARLLETFANQKIIQGLAQHGVRITQVKDGVQQLLPIEVIAQRILDRFGGSVKNGSVFLQNFFKEMGNVQGTNQARRVLISYMQSLDQAKGILKDVTMDHNELAKSLKAAQASPGVRWQEFTNQLKALALQIGTGVIPALGKMAGYLQGVATWVNNLSPHTKQAIGYFAAFIAVGTLVSGILLTLVGGFMSFIFALGGAKIALAAFGAEAGLAAPEVVLVMTAVAGLLYVMHKYPKQTEEVINKTKQFVIELLNLDAQLLKVAGRVWKVVVDFSFHLPKGVTGFLSKIKGSALDALKQMPGVGPLAMILDMVKKIQDARSASKNTKDTFGPDFHSSSIQRAIAAQNNLTKATKETAMAAAGYGIDNTKAFQKAYAEYKRAYDYAQKHPTDYQAQLRAAAAASHLQAVATAEQDAAAKKTVAAQYKTGKKYADQHIIDEAKRVAQLSKIARSEKTFAAWKAYYAALNKLQNDASNSQLSAVEKMFNLTDSSANKTVAKAKAAADKLKTIYKDVHQNLVQQFTDLKQQNEQAFGTLFSGPFVTSPMMADRVNWGARLNTKDLIKDLRSQKFMFDQWNGNLQKLSKQGLPQTYINQLRQLGPGDPNDPNSAYNNVKKLIHATPQQLKQYKDLWAATQRDINTQTQKQLTAQIKMYEKFGKNVALAIVRGLRSQDVSIETYIRGIIKDVFPKVAKAGGVSATTAPAKKPNVPASTNTKTETHHHKTEHTHYHITTTSPPESVRKQARDAHFQHRNRYGAD